ncbi:MAG: 3-hydroxyacyl-CoA dehydrogenase NAD-binding domain-containing protein [Thermodesulfobacteriota bacterium]|nr:3-hydroxyacyl-CoA dehydrogenase NAD-binding domain-containing protein [Thermodesulfobacteriota bacterium]
MKKIAVLGAGVMGNGIAQVCATAGYKVSLRDIDQKFVDRGMKNIEKNMNKAVKKGVMLASDMDNMLKNIKPTMDIKEAVDGAQLVIEAATENIDIKKAIFQEIDPLCPPETIFASNTTAKSISEMGAVTKRPERFIGMHFFNPPHLMRLIEVIRSLATSDETCDIIKELSNKLRKKAVIIKESPGFIVTRIFAVLINEAFFALMEGVASPEEIDEAMQLGVNLPAGPLRTADFMGIDICQSTMETLYNEFGDPKYRPCPLIRTYVRAGWLGVKTGRGVYDYSKK